MQTVLDAFRPFRWPLVFSVAAILFGQAIGVAFGVAEEAMKAMLQADANEVLAGAYGNDAAKAKAVVDKSWVYLKRAHLHAGALGASSVAVITVLVFLRSPLAIRRIAAWAIAVGSFGYGWFWLLAGFKAPALGSTGAAKESLVWLAWGSSGPLVLATVVVLALLIREAVTPDAAPRH